MYNRGENREINIFRAGINEEPQAKAAEKISDAELWATFKQGDEAAFVEIYKTYVNKLYNYGVKFCGDGELVKDCLQDFFIYLRKNRETLGHTTSIKFYLFKSFRRRVVDYIQARKSEQEKNHLVSGFQLQIEVSHEVKFIDSQLQEQQLLKLNTAIDALTEKEREAVFYYFYEGLGYQDIAEIMNFSHIASARRLIYRALSNIKEKITTVSLALLLYLIS
jgi:RNA polymerase sigma factor (sigma-70 family)